MATAYDFLIQSTLIDEQNGTPMVEYFKNTGITYINKTNVSVPKTSVESKVQYNKPTVAHNGKVSIKVYSKEEVLKRKDVVYVNNKV